MTVKAIQTRYKGYHFRSRLEARWAVFFDALGIEWEYEKEGFDTPHGKYLPDFYFPKRKTYVEIKPAWDRSGPLGSDGKQLAYYLGGKMTGWRDGIDLRGHWSCGPGDLRKCMVDTGRGVMDLDVQKAVNDRFNEIHMADFCFFWIDSLDCYGTLVEIGYSRAHGKRIVVYVSAEISEQLDERSGCDLFNDLWFVRGAVEGRYGVAGSPQEAINHCLPRYTQEELKCKALDNCMLICGEPGWCVVTHFKAPDVYRHNDCHNDSMDVVLYEGGIQEYTQSDIDNAVAAARSARFEHGQSGAT